MTDVLQRAREALPFMKETDDPYYETICELVAECERLQENQCTPEKCYGEIARLQEELKITSDRAAHNAEQDAAREQILREELARWQKIAAKAAATASKAIETTDVDWYKMVSEEDIQEAARELGIATGNHIRDTTKMMLTQEQRAALVSTCQIFQSAIDSESGKPLSEQVMLLVGINSTIGVMLTQSRPAWEITEDRKIALHQVEMLLTGNQPKDLHWDIRAIVIIRAMITEASQ